MFENRITLDRIPGTKYARFLTYPSTEANAEVRDRIMQLKSVGISSLLFEGTTTIGGVQILGKGCVGIVINALLNELPVAVKIRRLDADRSSLMDEANLLRLANSVEVGPQLIAATQNILATQLFNGLPLYKWAEHARSRASIKRVLRRLLIECFRLDAIGLDHGELSHAPRNVLVGAGYRPCIVDFESASNTRRATNVTSLIQYFLFGQLARSFGVKLYRNRKSMLNALTAYKQDGSVTNFENILQTLSL